MYVVVGVMAIATIAGLVALWPHDKPLRSEQIGIAAQTNRAEVVTVDKVACPQGQPGTCTNVTARLMTGSHEGKRVSFANGSVASDVRLNVGDKVQLARNNVPVGAAEAGNRLDEYSFSDFDRRGPMLALAAAFVIIVLLFGRRTGLRALIGLGASLLIVVWFVVPALLHGTSAWLVALVGSFAVMLLTIPLAHGRGLKTLAATIGTAVSLVLTLALAMVFVQLTHLSGFSSDEAAYLSQSVRGLSIQGLLLAGVVIGALGVLDDVTVTQASTVLALRKANPELSVRQLFHGALSVGRDHITATVNTLVLAYVGSSLPILLVFAVVDVPTLQAINGEAVAEQVVATLVGSIGLIAAVPITTMLTAVLAKSMRADSLDPGHAHVH